MVDWSLSLLAPEIVLTGCALLIMLVDPLMRKRPPAGFSVGLSAAAFLAAIFLSLFRWGMPVESAFGGRLLMDGMAIFLHVIFALIGLVVLIMALPWLRREGIRQTEFLVLLLFSTVGLMIMSSAVEMVTVFLGLELLSMGLYVMAGYRRDSQRSLEASLKYFLLGAFASALLVMGMALQWGTKGSLHLSAIAPGSGGASLSPLLSAAGFWLIIAGLGFKISAVPFHFWTADVYEGSPAPVTAFMATGTKAAAMAVLLRLFTTGFAPHYSEWLPVLWWLAVLTMSMGNLMAIVQSNIKRMLAFSSIAHAGYLLTALCAGSQGAAAALLFYLGAYTLMNLGAFMIVGIVERKGEAYQSIYDYAGLARRHPWLAAGMTIFLFSLAGIPATAGFTGKFFIFTEVLRGGHVGLLVIAVLNSLISVYYYLRVIYLMYMKEPWEESPDFSVPMALRVLLVLTVAALLFLGVLPEGLLSTLGDAAGLF